MLGAGTCPQIHHSPVLQAALLGSSPRPAPGATHKPNISNPPVQHSFERAKQDLEQVRISLCVLSERHHDTANQNHCWAVRQSQTEPVQMGQTLGPGPAEQMHLSMGREVIWHKCQNAV